AMKIRTLLACLSGLCMLAATAATAQDNKGTINTLDLDERRISIDYEDLILAEEVRIQTVSGVTRTTDHLAERQHVRYTLDRQGHVNDIRIYDPQKLLEQGFYTADEMNH
ncbi:MAG: hypothetical protein R3308_03660, partial [Thiohalobacterales bacterium]|nr:hypothetical protein [Thiohalobacterales bacterium]